MNSSTSGVQNPSVLVDARSLGASGIGRYLGEVLEVLLVDRRFSRVVLLGSPEKLNGYLSEHAVTVPVEVHRYSGGFYSPRAQLEWLRIARRPWAQTHATFFPHFDAPAFLRPRASLLTVQDLIHFKVPEAFPAWRLPAASWLFDRVVGSARRIVVSSQSTRNDLVERCPTAAGKVEVVSFGVGDVFRNPPIEPVDNRFLELAPFILCVGNRKQHKNLIAAVEVLARLRPEFPDLRLVLAGRSYGRGDGVYDAADALGVRSALYEIEMPTDQELARLYTLAEVLLFPSKYEGFGLPILEAMGCGAPVVASNRSAIPEVVGNAGLLCSPEDYQGMAEATRRLMVDRHLRAKMISRGRARAELYTWSRAARRVVDILYETAVGVPDRPNQSDPRRTIEAHR